MLKQDRKTTKQAGNKAAKRPRVANATFKTQDKVTAQAVAVILEALNGMTTAAVAAYFAACVIMARAYAKTPANWYRRAATAIRAELVGNAELQKACEALGLSKASWSMQCTRMARATIALIANGPDHYKTYVGAWRAGQTLIDSDGKKDPRAANAKAKAATSEASPASKGETATRAAQQPGANGNGSIPRRLHNAVLKLAAVHTGKVIPVLETEPESLETIEQAQAYAVEAVAALMSQSEAVQAVVKEYDRALGDSTAEHFQVAS